MIFKVFIPVMLFINIYESDFTSSLDIPLLLYALLAVIAFYLLLCTIVPKFVRTRPDASVMIQGFTGAILFSSELPLVPISIQTAISGSSLRFLHSLSHFIIFCP